MSKILLKIGGLSPASLIIWGALVFGLFGCRLGEKDRKIKELEQQIKSQEEQKVALKNQLKGLEINNYQRELSKKEIENLQSFTEAVQAQIKAQKISAPIYYKKGKQSIEGIDYEVPRDLAVISEQKIAAILDEVIYEDNGIPKIVAAYDVINGEHLVKREADKNEFEIYEKLANKPLSGIVSVFGTMVEDAKNLVFMKRYNSGNLLDILNDISEGKRPEFSDEEKVALNKELLVGLLNVHGMEIEIVVSSGKKEVVKLSHRDLKPENIFCDSHPNDSKPGSLRYSCAIGDFDTAIIFDDLSGTPGYFSPEEIAFSRKHKNPTKDALRAFNIEHGQKGDSWTMGLILASILMSAKGASIDLKAPLKTISKTSLLPNAYTAEILNELDKEWLDEKHKTINKEIMHAWDVVRLMLQAYPSERIDVKTALALMNKNSDFIIGQYINAAKTISAKKLVGGVSFYCYIDMQDHVHCQGNEERDWAKSSAEFQGTDKLANKVVKDLVAGPYNVCATLMDDTILCIGEDEQGDMTKLNGEKATGITIINSHVIIRDALGNFKSSPNDLQLSGVNMNPQIWTADAYGLIWAEGQSIRWQDLRSTNKGENKLGTDIANYLKNPIEVVKLLAQSSESGYLGITSRGIPFEGYVNADDLNDIFSCKYGDPDKEINIAEQSFTDIYLSQKNDPQSPWLRISNDKALPNGQMLKAGAWIGGNPCDPVNVIGNNDKVYDQIVIGDAFICVKMAAQTYICDR